MPDTNQLLLSSSWISFIKMILIFILALLILISLYYGLFFLSFNNLIINLPFFNIWIWSFNEQIIQIILCSSLISFIAFFIYYTTSIHRMNYKFTIISTFFSFILLFLIFLFLLFPSSIIKIIQNSFLVLSFLMLFSLFLAFGGINLYFMYMGLVISNEKPKNPISLNETSDNHHAILVVNYQGQKTPVFGQGIDILIKSFNNKNIPYKVYFCDDASTIINIIQNNKAKFLWIFGHGQKDAIRLPDQTLLYYRDIDFIGVEKKVFVGQFHCNPCIGNCDKSLAELIGIYGYVSNDYRDTIKNRNEIHILQQITKYSN